MPASSADLQVLADPTGAQNLSFSITTSPVYQSTPRTTTGLTTIALIISGAVLNNPFEADQTTVALDHNYSTGGYSFIDSCNGHPNDRRMYHYHGLPVCVSNAVDTAGQHSKMIGMAIDGFPVYGPNDTTGATPTDLDACNGHVGPTPEFPQGIYHYHLLSASPYSLSCLHGVVPTWATTHAH